MSKKFKGKEAWRNIHDPERPKPKIGDVFVDPETGDTVKVIKPQPYKFIPHGGMYIGLRFPRPMPGTCK